MLGARVRLGTAARLRRQEENVTAVVLTFRTLPGQTRATPLVVHGLAHYRPVFGVLATRRFRSVLHCHPLLLDFGEPDFVRCSGLAGSRFVEGPGRSPSATGGRSPSARRF